MAIDVVVPSLGDGVTHGTLIRWLKDPGERVEVDEPLFEVSADKVDAEVPSPISGVLVEIVRHMGDVVRIGDRVARIGTAEEWERLAPPRFGRPAAPEQSLLGATLHGGSIFIDDSADDPLGGAAPMPAGPGRVGLVTETDDDEPLAELAAAELGRMGVHFDRHRVPMMPTTRLRDYAYGARERGVRLVVVFGGAGGHLAAALAAETELPVVSVPREAAPSGSLLVPVGLAVLGAPAGPRGARQAATFAGRIMARVESHASAPASPLDDSLADELF